MICASKRLPTPALLICVSLVLGGCPSKSKVDRDGGDAPVGDGSPDDASSDGSEPDSSLPRCGDGAEDPGEECDDSNESPGDGCSADCLDEATCVVAIDDGTTRRIDAFRVTRDRQVELTDSLVGFAGATTGTTLAVKRILDDAVVACGGHVYAIQGRTGSVDQFVLGIDVSPACEVTIGDAPVLAVAASNVPITRAITCVADTVIVASVTSPNAARPVVQLAAFQQDEVSGALESRWTGSITFGDATTLTSSTGSSFALHLVPDPVGDAFVLAGYFPYAGSGVVGQMARFSVASNGFVTTLEPGGGAAPVTIGGIGVPSGIAIDPASHRFVVVGYDGPSCADGLASWTIDGLLPHGAPTTTCSGQTTLVQWPVFSPSEQNVIFASTEDATASDVRAFVLDPTTHAPTTRFSAPAGGGNPFVIPIFAGESLVSVASSNGEVRVFDATTGDSVDSTPVASATRLLGIAAVPCDAP